MSDVGKGTAGQLVQATTTGTGYTTATYPSTAGTSGNALTSDGTNWTSATYSPSAATTVLSKQITLTSAQVKALHATPIIVVANPGAGKFVKVVGAVSKLVYGGSNVFVAGSSQSLSLVWGSGGSIAYNGLMTSTTIASASSVYQWPASPTAFTAPGTAAASFENLDLMIQNTVVTEITGNAANDNTIVISVQYTIVTGS